MSVHGDIEDAADSLRYLANRLRVGSASPDQAASQMVALANELDDLAAKVKRAAHTPES